MYSRRRRYRTGSWNIAGLSEYATVGRAGRLSGEGWRGRVNSPCKGRAPRILEGARGRGGEVRGVKRVKGGDYNPTGGAGGMLAVGDDHGRMSWRGHACREGRARSKIRSGMSVHFMPCGRPVFPLARLDRLSCRYQTGADPLDSGRPRIIIQRASGPPQAAENSPSAAMARARGAGAGGAHAHRRSADSIFASALI